GHLYRAVMNIGYNPTFQDRRVSYEVHILDFNGDLYGEMIRVYLVEKLRDEKAFASIEELRVQIGKDAERGRQILVGSPRMP
ncbi:MAG: riboflavin kinase, partial [Deltaproteobacteria bacterium]|nr:riboflavin kinase [Deltaproteobacteria bacterium]